MVPGICDHNMIQHDITYNTETNDVDSELINVAPCLQVELRFFLWFRENGSIKGQRRMEIGNVVILMKSSSLAAGTVTKFSQNDDNSVSVSL